MTSTLREENKWYETHRSWLCIQKVDSQQNGLESDFRDLEFLNYIVENI